MIIYYDLFLEYCQENYGYEFNCEKPEILTVLQESKITVDSWINNKCLCNSDQKYMEAIFILSFHRLTVQEDDETTANSYQNPAYTFLKNNNMVAF